MSLENVNLAGAQLVNSDFSCTDLTRVDFSGAKAMNSRFDYRNCNNHISSNRSQCSGYVKNFISKEIIDASGSQWPFGDPPKTTCLEANFVGADFSDSLIIGDKVRKMSDFNSETNSCKFLLVLVGNMSGANFSNAKLTCVALIHAPPASKEPPDPRHFPFNGISFAGARLDRVALLNGPFRFTNFQRATLMSLFLNIGDEKKEQKADLDYSTFNEISCKAPNSEKYMPCLWVQRDYPKRLNLNLLWSTLETNLKPTKNDAFLCTPRQDLPALVEATSPRQDLSDLVGAKRIESAGHWLSTKMESTKMESTKMEPTYKLEPKPFHCLALEDPKKPHHLLQPKKP